MITIHKSQTADTRSCDFSKVDKSTLLKSSKQHIEDVGKALAFFGSLLTGAAVKHDQDKLTLIDWFHSDFQTGFRETGWWDNHRRINRHHLSMPDGVPNNVNLCDVLEYIADCVMAGKARTGTVFPLEVTEELLMTAFRNTVALLDENVTVEEETDESAM